MKFFFSEKKVGLIIIFIAKY